MHAHFLVRILIATDGSPQSQAAIDAVVGRPWPEGTIVRVVTAAPYPYLFTPFQWYTAEQAIAATIDEQSKEHAHSIADAAAGRLREAGFAAESVVREGDPRIVIVQEASDWNTDLIMIGSHGYTGLRRLLLGSVAQHVVSHAPCSVEVVRGREENADAS